MNREIISGVRNPFHGKWPGGDRRLLCPSTDMKSPYPHSSPSIIILLCWVWPRSNLDSTWYVSSANFKSNNEVYLLFLTCFFLKVVNAHCLNPRAQPASLLTDLLSHGIHVVLSLVLSAAQMPVYMELSTSSPCAWTYSQDSSEFLMNSSC